MVLKVLRRHSKLSVDNTSLDPAADLYQLGLTAHASVDVMLALEDAFDVQFPHELLRKSPFADVGAIRSAFTELGVA